MMKMPEVRTDFYALGGGLDLLTPAIRIEPGKVFDSQNYEPEISGGYRRIDGYECYDGRPGPTSRDYWLLGIAVTDGSALTVGRVITGATSGATATVLAIYSTFLVLGAVSGEFAPGENLYLSG